MVDLSVSKSDGISSVNADGITIYTVRVTNNGPSSVAAAILTDAVATGLTKTSVICSATPGRCLTPPSVAQLESGNFGLPNLAAGNYYEILIATTITAFAGSVTNTATVATPPGTSDSTPVNNSASDTDSVMPPVPTPTPSPLPIVTVSGQVLTPSGLGIRNAVVKISDSREVRQTATTNSFGVYTFNNVRSGETYFVSVSSKRYRFATRSLSVSGNLSNIDFIGLE